MSGKLTIPRVLIAAPSSGTGKTTVTCGLLAALKQRGVDTVAYKCGPDYIDPMFHKAVLGTPCRNLDLYFSTADEARSLFARGAAGHELAVLEGVMGFFDGVGGTTTQASAYDVARTIDAPVVLVMDGRSAPLSLAATIKGFKDFREDSHLAGVILNRCPKRMRDLCAPAIEEECGIPVLGYLPDDKNIAFESRHLGLVTAYEAKDLEFRLQLLAKTVAETVDIDAVLKLAASAPPLACAAARSGGEADLAGMDLDSKKGDAPPTIAVAKDEAFCFYYEENLELLECLGAKVMEFSPLRDETVPVEADALYLGGGYPELHAKTLSENASMLASVNAVHESGMPIFAECGGFLYLKESLKDPDGNRWQMAGVLPGCARYTNRLKRFGYVELTAQRDGLGVRAGESLRAHEFHYYDSDDNGDAFAAVKPVSGRSWECGVAEKRLLAGFPHLYFPSCPEFARRFVGAAAAYCAERADAGTSGRDGAEKPEGGHR